MARMAIDDSFLRDPRVARLGKLCGWSVRETRGALLDVFALCYDRVSSVLDVLDIDIAGELDGFAALMIDVGLAVRTPHGVRISGAAKRITYLQTRESTGRQGGVKSGEIRRSKSRRSPSRASKVTFAKDEGPVNPPDLVPDPSPLPAPDLVLAPDPVPSPDQEGRGRVSAAGAASSPAPSARRPPSHAKGLSKLDRDAAMAVLRKLGEQTGIEYRGGDRHTKLIVARYRDGFDELDLRKVIAYASRTPQEGGLGWNSDEKMRAYLRPETLFGPETIERYLDAARSWFKQRVAGEPQPSAEFVAWRDAEAMPRLAVVR